MTRNRSHGRISVSATAQPRELIRDRANLKGAWTAHVLTLYPEMFPGILGQSLTGKALTDGLWNLNPFNMRHVAIDKHRSVDDTPAGGGAGMVLRADIVGKAVDLAPSDLPRLYMSPRGARLSQARVRALSQGPGAVILCGRFEGVDQRVLDAKGFEEVSIGDYVLTGGELAAQVLIDACVRLIPRVLGNAESAQNESFSNGLLEHPQYTRPNDWDGHKIPEVLLSGHHGRIAAWRQEQSERLTKERRPDLWRAHESADPVTDQELSEGSNSAAKARNKDK